MLQETQSILSTVHFIGLFLMIVIPRGNFGMIFKFIGMNLLS